ncbi:MAG: cytochrome c oxidase subunit II [Bacteroidetes bacterium]|nr:cytochrome c oxidase subunit II [Bacteroidota bacterium]MBU1578641.1 cytochrome c oxidase subunit II [Bacteroidota bacterium]MBU2465226.1 cytochrome c oxidase subunit II [Bacteroidota bacterium]MBU2556157.1 cytochrome c oxidase subunit II [Bacteroidota bacterium]
MRTGASTFAEGVDLSLYIIAGISIFFLIGITAVMIYFVFRYSKKRNPKATNIEGSNTLEVIWTVIPTLLVIVMFYYGWMGYKPMRNVPDDAIVIEAYGQMWKFSFEYPDGKVTDSLVVPVNRPVKLNLNSRDVLHSFYIPAFRVKEDMVPNGENYLWFEPNLPGRYDILCAEYCGQLHSYMLSSITVVSDAEYNSWLTSAPSITDEHPGLSLLKQNACLTCHSQDGSKIIGPSFKGLFGKTEIVVTDGQEREVTVDETYITRSIKEPNADIVQGYMKGLMVSYAEVLSDEQIAEIIDYIKTLE